MPGRSFDKPYSAGRVLDNFTPARIPEGDPLLRRLNWFHSDRDYRSKATMEHSDAKSESKKED
jgi:hypothetical protein